jgi:hypothetical protein
MKRRTLFAALSCALVLAAACTSTPTAPRPEGPAFNTTSNDTTANKAGGGSMGSGG